jgi:hypothetical protein
MFREAVLLAFVVGVAGCQPRGPATRRGATATTTTAAAASPPAAARGAALYGLGDVLAAVSPGVIPSRPDGWTDAKVDVANADLARAAAGRPVTLALTAREVVRWEKGFALNGEPRERYDGPIAFWIYFREPNALDAARLELGQAVTVTGKLNAVRFEQRAGTPPNVARLYVEIDNAEVAAAAAALR